MVGWENELYVVWNAVVGHVENGNVGTGGNVGTDGSVEIGGNQNTGNVGFGEKVGGIDESAENDLIGENFEKNCALLLNENQNENVEDVNEKAGEREENENLCDLRGECLWCGLLLVCVFVHVGLQGKMVRWN